MTSFRPQTHPPRRETPPYRIPSVPWSGLGNDLDDLDDWEAPFLIQLNPLWPQIGDDDRRYVWAVDLNYPDEGVACRSGTAPTILDAVRRVHEIYETFQHMVAMADVPDPPCS